MRGKSKKTLKKKGQLLYAIDLFPVIFNRQLFISSLSIKSIADKFNSQSNNVLITKIHCL